MKEREKARQRRVGRSRVKDAVGAMVVVVVVFLWLRRVDRQGEEVEGIAQAGGLLGGFYSLALVLESVCLMREES